MIEYVGRELHRNVHQIEIDWLPRKKTPLHFLLLSDVHIENPKCDLKLLKSHLEEAKEKEAMVIINGDLFDLMEGKYDPRSNKASLHPEVHRLIYAEDYDYLDAVVEFAYQFLKPYADNIVLLGEGNHESAISKHREHDILTALATRLKTESKGKIYRGGYGGYLKLLMRQKNRSSSVMFRYHHGHGNAERSKGMLQIDVDAGQWPSADIIMKGHDHFSWHFPKAVERVSYGKGVANIYQDTQHHLRLGGYKDDIKDGYAGWAVERNFNRRALGGWWMELCCVQPKKKIINKMRFYRAD